MIVTDDERDGLVVKSGATQGDRHAGTGRRGVNIRCRAHLSPIDEDRRRAVDDRDARGELSRHRPHRPRLWEYHDIGGRGRSATVVRCSDRAKGDKAGHEDAEHDRDWHDAAAHLDCAERGRLSRRRLLAGRRRHASQFTQRLDELCGVLKSPGAIVFEAPRDERVNARRQRLDAMTGWDGRRVQDFARECGDRFTGEWRSAGDHFVEQHAERPDVGASIERFVFELFRRDGVWRTDDHPGARQAGITVGACDSKVEQHR